MTTPEHTRYRTTNWKSYNDGREQRGSFLIGLKEAARFV